MDPQDVAEALEDLNDVLEDALEQTERGINHVSRQLPTMSLKSDTVSPITVSPTTIIAGEGWFRRDAGSAEEPSVRTGTQTVFRVQPVGGRTGVCPRRQSSVSSLGASLGFESARSIATSG